MVAVAVPAGVIERILEVLDPDEGPYGRIFASCDVCASRSSLFDGAISTRTGARRVSSPRQSRAKVASSMDAETPRELKPIIRLLDAAALDIDAAQRQLIDPPNVLAANNLHQAAERILGAVRLHRGLLDTRRTRQLSATA